MPPEILSNENFILTDAKLIHSIDIWNFGILLIEIIYGIPLD
jgi:serine/threonine protein kinase